MRAIPLLFLSSLLMGVLALGCKQEVELYPDTDPLKEYLPLQTGKYITYQLDSLVFTSSGQKEETHVYQEKLLIDLPVTDNLGRKGYRVFRFLRDSAGKNPWISAGTNIIVPNDTSEAKITNTIEYIEDNLRFVRLSYPVREGRIWKGNGYLPTDPYGPKYQYFNNYHTNLATWDYTYGPTNESITLNGVTINNVISVLGPDETHNPGISDPNSFGYRTFYIAKYAKGIGMVYQETIMWDYQPKVNSSSFAYKVGFGVKRSMIDHN